MLSETGTGTLELQRLPTQNVVHKLDVLNKQQLQKYTLTKSNFITFKFL